MQAQNAQRAQLQNDEEQKLRRLQEELRQVGMGMGGWGDGDGYVVLTDLTNSKFAKT